MAQWIDKNFNASFITPFCRHIFILNLMVFGLLVQKKIQEFTVHFGENINAVPFDKSS